MASQMAQCLQNTVKAEIRGATPEDAAAGKYCVFTASGYSVKFDGYTALYDDGSDDEKEGKTRN